jgi:hypothetical protein
MGLAWIPDGHVVARQWQGMAPTACTIPARRQRPGAPRAPLRRRQRMCLCSAGGAEALASWIVTQGGWFHPALQHAPEPRAVPGVGMPQQADPWPRPGVVARTAIAGGGDLPVPLAEVRWTRARVRPGWGVF